jgi:hypothetical protein
MQRLKANCGYIQETLREELYDEFTGDQNQEIGQRKSHAKIRIQKQLIGLILAQTHNLFEYIEDGTAPRNENEVYELIHSNMRER